MTQDLYSVKELVNSIIEEYQLPTQGDEAFLTYRQKTSRTLKELGIWDKGIPKTVGKKKIMYFTEHQRQELLADKSFYNYIRDRSQSEEINNSKRYEEIQKAIEERRISHIEYLESLKHDDYNEATPVITKKEFDDYKRDMMITALFQKFFSPINENLLLNDLYQVQILEDEVDLQIADIEAEHRLSHPNLYYYKEK